jgi:MFS family permease
MEGQRAETLNPRARRAIWGAFAGFFVDGFDIYLPVFALAPALIYFFSPEIPGSTAAILVALTFVATLIGRPLGALVFGGLADRIGRKRTTVIVVTGFGALTLVMGLLPGYEQWGLAAPIILIVLRLIAGVFLGGEYSAANPLAMEYCPKEKRGFYGSVIQSAPPFSQAFLSFVTLMLLLVIPAGGLESPYVQWGWRIPFFIGAAMAFALALYYRFSVAESEVWEKSEKTESPLRALFSGDNLRDFLQVFVLMTGVWLSILPMVGTVPPLLASRGLSSTEVTITLAVATAAAGVSYIGGGVLSQRIGRRTFLMLVGFGNATAGVLFYYLLLRTTSASGSLVVVVLITMMVQILFQMAGALNTSYVNERFRTSVRGSGFGLGYSLAIILPSLYAFYQTGLANFMPSEYTILPILALGGLLTFVGAALGPETKDVDFFAEASASRERPRAAQRRGEKAEPQR